MRTIHGETFPHVYQRAISAVLMDAEQVKSPRGLKCREITPLIMQFPVARHEDGLFESPARSTDRRYLAGEMMWYYHGRNDLAGILPYSKFWQKIANEDGTLNSAYGWQIFRKKNDHGMTEWQWAIHSLAKDPDTRQAVMVFHAPRQHWHGNKDVPCTLNVTFARRHENLDMNVVMRSQDLWIGVPYDIPFFISLMRNAAMLLGMSPGIYTHIALNMHAYEKDWPTLARMVEDGITSPEDPIPRHERPWVDHLGALWTRPEEDPQFRYFMEVSEWQRS